MFLEDQHGEIGHAAQTRTVISEDSKWTKPQYVPGMCRKFEKIIPNKTHEKYKALGVVQVMAFFHVVFILFALLFTFVRLYLGRHPQFLYEFLSLMWLIVYNGRYSRRRRDGTLFNLCKSPGIPYQQLKNGELQHMFETLSYKFIAYLS